MEWPVCVHATWISKWCDFITNQDILIQWSRFVQQSIATDLCSGFVTYLRNLRVVRQNLTGHQRSQPPLKVLVETSFSFRQSRIELELGDLYPRIGGLSGTWSINLVRCRLKRSRLSNFRTRFGMQFHIAAELCSRFVQQIWANYSLLRLISEYLRSRKQSVVISGFVFLVYCPVYIKVLY